MTSSERIALGVQSLGHSLSLARRLGLWAPWLPLGLLEAVLLSVLWGYAHPWASWAMVPALQYLVGNSALHYPGVLERLPALTQHVQIVAFATFGLMAAGAATRGFVIAFQGERSRMPGRLGDADTRFGAAGARFGALLVAGLPFFVAFALLMRVLDATLAPAGQGPLRVVAHALALYLASLGLRTAVIYLPALIVVEGRSPRSAWGQLPSAWRSGGLGALTAVVLLTAPIAVLRALGVAWLAPRLHETPELALLVAAVDVMLGLLVAFVSFGAGTVLYLGTVARRSEEEGW